MISSANLVTLLRLLMALMSAFTLNATEPHVGIKFTTILFTISIILDKLDGMIARKYNCCTTFGKHFDIVVDKIVLAVFFLCLLDLRIISRHLVAASFIRDLLTQAFRNYAASRGVILRTYSLSKAQYVIQCIAIASGLLSFVLLEMKMANLLRQASIICFIIGLALGCLVLGRLIAHHWREVF